MVPAAARFSIVVASHDARATVADCLEWIRRQAGGEAELLVVDNSTDGTADVLRERFPEIRTDRQWIGPFTFVATRPTCRRFAKGSWPSFSKRAVPSSAAAG